MAIILAAGQTTVSIEQDKDAVKAYRFELAALLPPGDQLMSVTWNTVTGITISRKENNSTAAVAWFSGGTKNKWYSFVATWLTASGATDQIVVRIFIKEDAELEADLGSALFPNKFTAVAALRRDQLMVAAQNHFAGVTLSGAYLWDKLRAAEADVSRTLRVKFAPTTFFPAAPTEDQIEALEGAPWELDEGYDYDPAMYSSTSWGLFTTHSSPVISVEEMCFAYPANGGPSLTIPLEWLQLNRKYGQVQIVPMATSAAVVLTPLILGAIAAGRIIPNMVRITYTAGLANAAADYPDLVDAVKKMAILKIIEDGFQAQSGSISADGLSQSMSVDMSKYEDSIDLILTGRKGSNGGLRAAIHGITMGVM